MTGPNKHSRCRAQHSAHLGYVRGRDERHAVLVTDDERAADAAAIARNVHCIRLRQGDPGN